MTAHRVVVLLLPRVWPLDLGIPVQVFATDPHYDLTVCDAGDGAPLMGGLLLGAAAGPEALERADTVVVPGYDDPEEPPAGDVLDALRAAHARGARMLSVCTGAFALAAAGLLDGRPATTHWQRSAALQRRYPAVDVRADRLYVDDGDVLTSAGVTAGVDLCLHVVRRDHGAAAANTRARAIVAPPRRPGGQAQFVERARPPERGRDLAGVRGWMMGTLAERHTVDDLARRAHLSRRTFVRRFREETGTSPMAWLTAIRVDRACEILETTSEPVGRLGELTGLGSPAAVRATFEREVGTSPRAYRETFRHAPRPRAGATPSGRTLPPPR